MNCSSWFWLFESKIAGARNDRGRREDHVAVELLILPVAIGVDQANGRTAADIPRQGAVKAPLLVVDVGSQKLVELAVVEVGVGSAEEAAEERPLRVR